MSSDPQNSGSQIQLKQRAEKYLCQQLGPLLVQCALAPDGLFYEQLSQSSQPEHLGYRRILVQCRQVFSLVTISELASNPEYLEKAKAVFELTIQKYYRGAVQGWIFSLDAKLLPLNEERDLYAHSFVLLTCAALLQASGEDKYRELAEASRSFIVAKFRAPTGGFYEALDNKLQPLPKLRRQNPHMHLIEGCLAMYESSQEQSYLALADEILELLQSRFVDFNTGTLREYFEDNLEFHSVSGAIVEPGHHFEWAWLLTERIRLGGLSVEQNQILKALGQKLLEHGLQYGWDPQYGGFYDEITPAGEILKSSKRIWPLMEAIKALKVYGPQQLHSAESLLNFAFDHYLNEGSGGWTEHFDQTFTPLKQSLPGSTAYHISLALAVFLRG